MDPLGNQTSHVEKLTCYYWARPGGCKFKDDECKYAHYHTGLMAEQPIRLRPGEPAVAGTNLRRQALEAPASAMRRNISHPAFREYQQQQHQHRTPQQYHHLHLHDIPEEQQQHQQPLQQQGISTPSGNHPAPSNDSFPSTIPPPPSAPMAMRSRHQFPQHIAHPPAQDTSQASRSIPKPKEENYGPNMNSSTAKSPLSANKNMTKEEFVQAMKAELKKRQDSGEWDFGTQTAAAASELCAEIWKKEFGDFGLG